MWIWNKMLASIISASILAWVSKCSDGVEANSFNNESKNLENIEVKNIPTPEILNISELKKDVGKQLSICLETDDNNSFTHKKILETIEDPNNTILEFPISQLYQKYWDYDRPHPLVVPGVGKDFRALLWKNWIERLMSKTKQKLNPRAEEITSDTKYEMWDTLRFTLINPLLKDDFPKYLTDQLEEEWFEWFSDTESTIIKERILNKKNRKNKKDSDSIYDIVVKKVPSWRDALAVYKDWEIFMATYVSVWLNNRKTKTWQFKIIGKNPYYRSKKYKSPMPDWLNFDEWWFWLHQWNVTWYPASHWCVRLPGIYANALYSLVKDAKNVDVYISKILYKTEK